METTSERFTEMLEILPPQVWIGGKNWQMFQVGEASDHNEKGATYATFLEIGGKFYELGDHNIIGEGKRIM